MTLFYYKPLLFYVQPLSVKYCVYQTGGRGRTCTYEGETPTDLQSVAFAAQPHAHNKFIT